MINFRLLHLFILIVSMGIISCSDDDDNTVTRAELEIPNTYVSENYESNVLAEATVIADLSSLTTAVNEAEINAQGTEAVADIEFPEALKSVTSDIYTGFVDVWLVQLVSAANSPDAFQLPAVGESPAPEQQGGLLGTRLLDEVGLELEQMIQKGSFGSALYNHAITVVEGIKNGTEGFTESSAVDRLVEIIGTNTTFDQTTAAATYAARRSNHQTETGFFYDIRKNLITAKAAMESGIVFNNQRDEALDEFLLNWEKSNFATVIYYANAAKNQLTEAFQLAEGEVRDEALGNAMHAYAEGVAFTRGFKGVTNKLITDVQIDNILALLLAPEGEKPQSFRFINEPALLTQLDDVISEIKDVFSFTDEEVTGFFESNNL